MILIIIAITVGSVSIRLLYEFKVDVDHALGFNSLLFLVVIFAIVDLRRVWLTHSFYHR